MSKNLKLLLIAPPVLLIINLVFSLSSKMDLLIPSIRIMSGIHIFFPIINVFFLNILKPFNYLVLIFITVVMTGASYLHLSFFSEYTVQFMILLGTTYLIWTTWHFGTQAQGLFRFLSFDNQNFHFRKLEAFFLGFTYFFMLPYTWLANNQRFELLFPFELDKNPIHINIIAVINLIQIVFYFYLVKRERGTVGWSHWLAAYYMMAPICIGLTPNDFFLMGYFIYLLPHHLTEVFFQTHVSKGIIKKSRTPRLTMMKMIVPFGVCVITLYLCYRYKSISLAASTGQVQWARMNHAPLSFHFSAFFFFLSSFIHFYIDSIMYRFRDQDIRSKVLPFLTRNAV